ncbi:MAG: sulfotransferase [Caulobacteraceae bacterium]|nr:sulfotransferase [Caulobacteraceae bacterium]
MDARLLDPERAIEEAKAQTGLSDFDDADLPARLARLMARLGEAGLDEEGRRRAHGTAVGFLVARLQVIADRRRYPIDREEIARPIIVTGAARSGTTLLQMLLGQAPGARLLKFWEVMRPSPPPSLAGPDDPRRAQGDADWREILERIPAWLVSHPYNGMLGDNPPECERLWAMDLRAVMPSGWWRTPVAMVSAGPPEPAAQLRTHKLMLRQLQYGAPPRRWVLKGVRHHFYLDAVLDAYPDATVVWIHRDPVQAIASRVQLLTEIYEGIIRGGLDRGAMRKAIVAQGRAAFAELANARMADDPRVHHLLYKAFTADPLGEIERLCARAGLPFGPEFRAAMEAWLQKNPTNRYGRFGYGLDVFDEPIERMHREFEPYRARFGVPIEAS